MRGTIVDIDIDLGGLVNNARRTLDIPLGEFERLTAEDGEAVLRTNVIGTFLVTRVGAPPPPPVRRRLGRERRLDGGEPGGGQFAPLLRVQGRCGPPHDHLAHRCGTEVRVNDLAPGLIETPRTEDFGPMLAGLAAIAPPRRTGVPDDMANACAALVGIRCLTGQTLIVDGGLRLAT